MLVCIVKASSLLLPIQSAISFRVSNAAGALSTTSAIRLLTVFNTEPLVEALPFNTSIASSVAPTRATKPVLAVFKSLLIASIASFNALP